MKRFATLALLVALVAAPAYAGIVVCKSGRVVVGTIEDGDVTEKTVTVRNPVSADGHRLSGVETLERSDVRWFDAKSDELTDAYFDLHLDKPLDLRWAKYAEEYRIRKTTTLDPGTIVPFKPRLVALPYKHQWGDATLSVRYPIGWNVIEPKGDAEILIIESPDGRARLHLFVGELPGARARVVTKKALERLQTHFEFVNESDSRCDWETTLERNGRGLHALRRLVGGEKTTAFATAYADARDWEKVRSLLKEALDTFQAVEK